jgi:hypothetical protein
MADAATAERIERRTAMLRSKAIDLEMPISADGRIGESDLAILLDVKAETLRDWRTDGKGPAYFDLSVAGSRTSYDVDDVACWIEHRRRVEAA